MPVISGSIAVPANGVNDNILSGSQFEFLPYNAHLSFGLTGSAAGLQVDAYSGQDVLAEAMALPAVNRQPVNPDDFTLQDVAAGGERLKVRVRNTTAGALTVFWTIIITPL